MTRYRKKLSAAFVRTVEQPGLYWDEHGLILRVKPSGYKQWIQRLFIHGKRRELGLGSIRLVTLAQARERAIANRRLARSGGNPLASRRQSVPTFEQAAGKVYAMYRPNWRSAHHAAQWRASLRGYVYPKLGRMRVDGIRTADVMAVLSPIWNTRQATARRVRQRIGTVMKWAIAQGYRMDNPAGEALGAALPKQGGIQRHFKALPYGEVAGAIRTVRQSEAAVAVKLGFEFLVSDGVPVGGDARGAVGGDRPGGGGVDGSPGTDEAPERAPGAVVCGSAGDPGRGGTDREIFRSGVSDSGRWPTAGPRSQHPAAGTGNRGRAAWVPLLVPGLGGGADRCAPCGDGGGVVARDPQSGGSRLCPLGPVRASASPHG